MSGRDFSCHSLRGFFEVRFSEPHLTVYSSENQNRNKNKPFTYIVELQNVFSENGKAKIIKNGQNKFSADNVNAHFEQLVLDEKNQHTLLRPIFQYQLP